MVTLEEALAKAESESAAALKAAKGVGLSFKKVLDAAKHGNLKEIEKYLRAAEEGVEGLRQKFAAARESWDIDAATYLSDGFFAKEVRQAAAKAGIKVYELDDRLYCYPSLIRLLPDDRTVLIDKHKVTHLRPSVLVEHLKQQQGKPVRFKPESFLKSLKSAYDIAVSAGKKKRGGADTVAPLAEVYRILTLLPGQSKEYSKQEFARDLYLLDQEMASHGNNGPTLGLHTARGGEPESKIFAIVSKNGELRRYYGISFAGGE